MQVRHVFHLPSSGSDCIRAWQAATGEPCFVWGRGSRVACRIYSSLRGEFRRWQSALPAADFTCYHDGHGADLLGPYDSCKNRLLLPHTWPPRWQPVFAWALRCTGKVMVGSDDEKSALLDACGWIPERFVQVVPQPSLADFAEASVVATPAEDPTLPCNGNAAPITGVWLQGEHWKRSGNRLRGLVDRWDPAAGSLQVIADGKPPKWSKHPAISWHAGLALDAARARMRQWQATLLLDDFRLQAPWLLEAIAHAVFPLRPEGDNPADRAQWQLDGAPSPYPWGDLDAALELLRQWYRCDSDQQAEFRRWAASTAHPHQQQLFLSAYHAAVQVFANQRPVQLRTQGTPLGWYPLSWHERIQRLRSGLRG